MVSKMFLLGWSHAIPSWNLCICHDLGKDAEFDYVLSRVNGAMTIGGLHGSLPK